MISIIQAMNQAWFMKTFPRKRNYLVVGKTTCTMPGETSNTKDRIRQEAAYPAENRGFRFSLCNDEGDLGCHKNERYT